MRATPTLTLTFVLCGLLALATAQDPTPTPTPSEAPATPAPSAPVEDTSATLGVPYFPLEPGRRWTYRISWTVEPIGETKAEKPTKLSHRLDVFAAKPQRLNGQPVALLEWKLDGTLAQRCYYRVEESYLRCVRRIHHQAENVRPRDFTPAQPLLPVAPQVGQTWNWKGKNGEDEGKQSFKVLRTEKIETGAGTFEAIVVESVYEGDEDSGTLTRWLVRGIGIVKEVSELKTPTAMIRTEGLLARFEKGN